MIVYLPINTLTYLHILIDDKHFAAMDCFSNRDYLFQILIDDIKN